MYPPPPNSPQVPPLAWGLVEGEAGPGGLGLESRFPQRALWPHLTAKGSDASLELVGGSPTPIPGPSHPLGLGGDWSPDRLGGAQRAASYQRPNLIVQTSPDLGLQWVSQMGRPEPSRGSSRVDLELGRETRSYPNGAPGRGKTGCELTKQAKGGGYDRKPWSGQAWAARPRSLSRAPPGQLRPAVRQVSAW